MIPHLYNEAEARWQVLLDGLGIVDSTKCFAALIAAYGEKHRFYHTLNHIDAMLGHFELTASLTERPYELALAIWFHDAIYNPLSSNNEKNSATWAKQFLHSNNQNEEMIARVDSLIMATAHQQPVQLNDEKLIVDIDLAILGANAEVYDQFERNVRKEYRLIPGIIYRRKRKKLLQSFISKPYLYHLEYFRDAYEVNARINIERTIKKL